jgi:hypothetical protein
MFGTPSGPDYLALVHFLKNNPEEFPKFAFSVPSGKLLGFFVLHRGIEANPDKVKSIKEMRPPRNLKEM